MKIEISFDDGNISDIRAARLMEKHCFKGTFYNSNAELRGTTKMTCEEISREILHRGHEIGGHTLSHPSDMKLMPDDQMKMELVNVYAGTPWIYPTHFPQKLVNKFCYPRGRHDERVRQAVKDAGYLEARTTTVLKIRNESGDPYQTPTTVHMFQRLEYDGVAWPVIAREYFMKALEESKTDDSVFFSLWGHTRELDQQDDWENFENFLIFMKEALSTHETATNVASSV